MVRTCFAVCTGLFVRSLYETTVKSAAMGPQQIAVKFGSNRRRKGREASQVSCLPLIAD
jgi:hypothetical protein